MKNKTIVIPLVLLFYLFIMSYIGYSGYSSGEFSATRYFGVIIGSLFIIILLYFSLKRKEKLKKERENDINKNSYK